MPYASAKQAVATAININVTKQNTKKLLEDAKTLQSQGQLAKARKILDAIDNYYRKPAIAQESNAVDILFAVADLYKSQGELIKALPLYQLASKHIEKKFGHDNIYVAMLSERIGNILTLRGSYDIAEPLLLDTIKTREAILGRKNEDTLSAISNLANMYQEKGQYDKSEPLYLEVLSAREQNPGDLGALSTILGNIATFYQDKGQYDKAENYYLRALELRKKLARESQNEAGKASILANLGFLKAERGELDQAEKYLLKSFQIRQDRLGPEHPETAISINNLAFVYQEQGNLKKAKELYLRSLAIEEKTWGRKSLGVARIANNLAFIEEKEGNYKSAEQLYRKALAILESLLGDKHVKTADALNNLAGFYMTQRNYQLAEKLLRRSLLIKMQSKGVSNLAIAATLSNLGGLYLAKNDCKAAIKVMKDALEMKQYWLFRELPLLPNGLRKAQVSRIGDDSEAVYSLAKTCQESSSLLLATRLNRQGMLAEIEKRQGILVRSQPPEQGMIEQIQSLNQQISNIDTNSRRRLELIEQKNQTEANLYQILPALNISRIGVSEVAKFLPVGDVLIEYQKYRPYVGNNLNGGDWRPQEYMAIILDSESKISMIQLGPAKPIDEAIHQALKASSDNNADASKLWARVSLLVLAPLKTQLAGRKQWFISPDGELNRVPFAALPSPVQPSETVGSTVQLRLLTTGRDLVRLEKPSTKGQSPLIMADPNYDHAQIAASHSIPSIDIQVQQRSSTVGSDRWSPLPATKQEGEQVAALLGVNSITGDQATTTRLQQSQGPRVLHVATHGFFAADQVNQPNDPLRSLQETGRQIQGFRGEDPLLRSGLVLAGANQPEADPNDDGYLTASEAAKLQLEGTELVVLSACATGQGDIRSGEGVYGLQRALTVAGARSTLLSLWKVDDSATAEFMTRFYTRLKAGEGRADALAATQKEFRDGQVRDPLTKLVWNRPYYWAAWQLVGDWRPIKGL